MSGYFRANHHNASVLLSAPITHSIYIIFKLSMTPMTTRTSPVNTRPSGATLDNFNCGRGDQLRVNNQKSHLELLFQSLYTQAEMPLKTGHMPFLYLEIRPDH